ncbi:SDR family NAD(P)-dependent oxidoreductase [Nocardioides caeni]|uniref:SDR family oxidoreductase n=1 Tax=Nocardioides caeni TaxID=574700 RepID=A0A4V4HKJ8_9ACTN|nr:SDR family oxidoreductase [Nocardioides caeni]THV14656.1 SDR family oxidoreductase [Nocardioides caeni]
MTAPAVAVVTGAARGIGRALAEQLADRGHEVLLTDIDGAAAQAAADAIGRGAWAMAHDVRDAAGHRAVAEAATARGPLRVWVNNAGVLFAGEAWEHPDEQVDAIVDINVKGVLGGCRAAVGAMGESGGRILNVASISALTPVPGLALYAATKAAVLSFTTSLQGDLDHAGLPIRVRALCPDVVATAMVHDVEKDPGAALLFAGPKPLDERDVAAAGLALLDSRQLFRVVPRWRGAMVRAGDVLPAVGLKAVAAMRGMGDRAQAKR